MIIMSPESLDEAERLCRSYPNYRVCIYCESSARALTVYEVLLDVWHGTRGDRYFGGGLALFFPETNSVVRIMEPQDLRVTRLYSCHEVVADIDVQLDEDIIQRLDRLVVNYELPVTTLNSGYLRTDHNIIVDEFSHDGWWNDGSEYTLYFENGLKITAIPKTPDIGEIEPSTELLEYIRGEYGTTDRMEFKACN